MNMKFLGLVFLIIYSLGALGWCLNLYKLTQLDFASPYKAEVIRIVGITPLGAVAGWMELEEEEKHD
tara:strand:- start:317 stop:517 length:201 start_codon:yes stop_codon:yes gene_type:complete